MNISIPDVAKRAGSDAGQTVFDRIDCAVDELGNQ